MESLAVNQNTWTILAMMNWSSDYLSQKGFDESRLTAELLLSHALGCERISLYTHFDKPLTSDELVRFKSLLKRRLGHEPIQYILGETEFMGLRFRVDRRVLIPRPETEVLVESVIDFCKKSHSPVERILDVGTGSGNIAISLAHFLENVGVDSIDISPDALTVAENNIVRHHLEHRVQLFQLDFLQGASMLDGQKYDILVSNPPYISAKEFHLLSKEIREYEPVIATTDYSDGTTFFTSLAGRAPSILHPGGSVFVEMAYNQSNIVRNIFNDAGYHDITITSDYGGNQRVLRARLD